MSPVLWWDLCSSRAAVFAVRALSVVPNTSACERNWSDFGFIGAKRRNRLSAQKH